jgi:hypothetical protein
MHTAEEVRMVITWDFFDTGLPINTRDAIPRTVMTIVKTD